jgi:hypothetical protein
VDQVPKRNRDHDRSEASPGGQSESDPQRKESGPGFHVTLAPDKSAPQS